MPTVDIRDPISLSELIKLATFGNDVVILDEGKAVARLASIPQTKGKIKFGSMKGKIRIAHDFDGPLPDDIQAAFEGK